MKKSNKILALLQFLGFTIKQFTFAVIAYCSILLIPALISYGIRLKFSELFSWNTFSPILKVYVVLFKYSITAYLIFSLIGLFVKKFRYGLRTYQITSRFTFIAFMILIPVVTLLYISLYFMVTEIILTISILCLMAWSGIFRHLLSNRYGNNALSFMKS